MMSSAQTQPYGLWDSPITAARLAGGMRLSDVQWDSDGKTLVWLEGRSGKNVLVCASLASQDAPRELTTELAVRAQVGYGGGDFTVAGGRVFFVAKPGRLYQQPLYGGAARPITPAFGSTAAPTVSSKRDWVLFVHSYEDQDVLALVDTAGQQWPQRLVSGHDFYMQPRWHPDSRRIAYIAWNHPQMPWDGTQLYLATLRAGNAGDGDSSRPPVVAETRAIAGGEAVAIFQPEFSPDGRYLAYVSDRSGWGQIYLYDLEQGTHRQFTSAEAEHGMPAWVQGMRTYGWAPDSQHIYFLRNERGFARLYRQSIQNDIAEPVAGLEQYTWFSQPAISPTADTVALLASAGTQPLRLVTHALMPSGKPAAPRILRRTQAETILTDHLSEARPVAWETAEGAEVHGMLYLPPGITRDDLDEDSILPPAIVRIHGGPTAQAVASYDDSIQFFTTRGYTLLLVNYRGSTGYGRAYMQALRANWGELDVEDAVSGARFLTSQKYADPTRLVIMGGSSGGYTVLETLCRVPGVFKAGICLYGISNLFTLTADTHKFESRYLDGLVGKLPADSAVYRERSPIFHAHLLKDPVALFQGEEDTVVPRDQADAIVAALRRSGVPHEYHIYPGEGHGWRKQETIEHYYQTVLAFLRQYVLFA